MSHDARAGAERAKAHAYAVGFDLAGIATLGTVETAPQLDEWLAAGHHGEMAYLERGRGLREDTTRPEPGMRTAIVVARDYGGKQPSGPVARYARGDDYHEVMRAQLRELHASLERELGVTFAARAYVDTGPILERDLARRAGLGWFGKNTMLINPKRGSFFFLGALFTTLDLAADEPFATDHCGTCTRCLEACPTGAFVEPRVMDATKCISYLTIEHRSAMPSELRSHVSGLVFGCDICQDVCPWNEKFASMPRADALAPRDDRVTPDLREWLSMTDEQFRARFRGSAMTRAKRRGLARNVAVALGNRRDEADVPALVTALRGDPESLVRMHAAWALGQFDGSVSARDGLIAARDTERDSSVRSEIDVALRSLDLP
ncbi:MAG TPA: tRNA epoxyqueuosine(34) reductase QueG [Gemmatimonadaceae bacterium]|nr:tRNA epoxyqueuosine(34) reductase QueG [Gemmatimonadaceae bacterium]